MQRWLSWSRYCFRCGPRNCTSCGSPDPLQEGYFWSPSMPIVESLIVILKGAAHVMSCSLLLPVLWQLVVSVAAVESVSISQGVGGIWQTAAGSCSVSRHTSLSILSAIHTNTHPTSLGTLCHHYRNQTWNNQTTRKVCFLDNFVAGIIRSHMATS